MLHAGLAPSTKFCFLPPEFTTATVRVLRGAGAVTEKTKDKELLFECADRFPKLCAAMTAEEATDASNRLAQILRSIANVHLDDPLTAGQGPLALRLAQCRIFQPAKLPAPFSSTEWAPLVSMAESADFADWKLVANGIAVLSQSVDDSKQLRRKLLQPEQPNMMDVAKHATNTAGQQRYQVMLAAANTYQQTLQTHMETAVLTILESVQDNLTQMGSSRYSRLVDAVAPIARHLKIHPWLPMGSAGFIQASALCFNISAPTNTSMH